MSTIGFCDRNDATGLTVEAVYDPRPLYAADAREVPTMGQQAVNESAGGVPRAWMHHEPCGLVNHHQDQALSVLPAVVLCLVLAELDDVLITACRGTSRRARKMD